MIAGYNHNVRYKGQVFHVQTEDGGDKNPCVVTYLFFKGNVITSQKTDYRDMLEGLKGDAASEKITKIMQEQHKAIIKSLVKGDLDELEGIKVLLPPSKEKAPFKSSTYQIFNPDKTEEKLDIDGNKEEKSLDEMILEYLTEKKTE